MPQQQMMMGNNFPGGGFPGYANQFNPQQQQMWQQNMQQGQNWGQQNGFPQQMNFNPQGMQQGGYQEEEPLPFPPAHILAQYPPDYRQEQIVYYQQLRRQQPELYQQYVDYYNAYYDPLYSNDDARLPDSGEAAPSNNNNNNNYNNNYNNNNMDYNQRAQQQQHEQANYAQYQNQPEPQHQQQQSSSTGLQRQASTLSQGGTLNRQSSIRRVNSMKRNEVNQMKNTGGLQRLPSMRKN
ncbi:hypothetical protein AGDE_13201 [Angomonas deanei]|uniref:Uncharacterized protein n=1 Tax=Angomonas deanei TaxID=59799 RepID=A0A7G2CQX5_9TRYP|nr:hypothetical protein AGDE_13201 [Angomonas deanei]CAD2221401.1 hypothetical protein, conserved [Angomonas deanei]|eukprot:EPY22552.1 hypothetical protein AGDE_13201 [Angomonas deanei]